MKFTKMHGAGNDFIIINNMEEKLTYEELSKLAKTLCQRRTSIGADGLMAVERPSAGFKNSLETESYGDYRLSQAKLVKKEECEKADVEGSQCDFRMIFFNADGTEGEMCGNGARCIARYGYEHGLAGKVQRIETASGIVEGERISDKIYKVRLNPVTHMDLDCVEVSGSDCGATDCKGSNCGATDCPTSICSTSERTISQNPQDKLMVSYVELGTPGLPHAVVGYKGLKSIIESKRRTDKQVYETQADRITDCKCDGTHADRITDWNCDEVNIDAITDYNCQKFDAAKEERIARIDEELNYLSKIAKAIRYHEAFPRGANVNFYEIRTSEIYVLTYERGVEDFTLACGTGVASTVAVLTEQGLVSGHGVRAHVLGGDLSVDVVSEKFPSKSVASEEAEEMIKQHLYLTGEAEFVAQGEILHV